MTLMTDKRALMRQRIQERLDALKMKPRTASTKAGLGADAVRNILADRSKNPTIDTIVALAEILECSVDWLAGGGEPWVMQMPGLPVMVPDNEGAATLVVEGTVQAGAWLEYEAELTGDIETVPVRADKRFPTARQYALKVVGHSVNKLIEDGEYALCADFLDLDRDLAAKDIVVVLRKRGKDGIHETSIKQVEIRDGEHQLWPRSTDRRFQSPIELSAEEPDVSVQIIALVWGKFRRF